MPAVCKIQVEMESFLVFYPAKNDSENEGLVRDSYWFFQCSKQTSALLIIYQREETQSAMMAGPPPNYCLFINQRNPYFSESQDPDSPFFSC